MDDYGSFWIIIVDLFMVCARKEGAEEVERRKREIERGNEEKGRGENDTPIERTRQQQPASDVHQEYREMNKGREE